MKVEKSCYQLFISFNSVKRLQREIPTRNGFFDHKNWIQLWCFQYCCFNTKHYVISWFLSAYICMVSIPLSINLSVTFSHHLETQDQMKSQPNLAQSILGWWKFKESGHIRWRFGRNVGIQKRWKIIDDLRISPQCIFFF